MDVQAPLPPPPPPPSNGMFSVNHPEQLNLNSNRNLSDRSQLLIDIEKGKTLKKISNSQKGFVNRPINQISSSNECNGIDNNNYNEDSTNPIKNQLQAELCTTLHRRQNGGNKKPNFIVPKNTTINAINNQLRELQNNSQTQPTTNGKPTIETTPTSQSPTSNAKDKEEKPKLLISHGKPNFKISPNSISSKKFMEKDENSANDELILIRRRLKSVESLDEIDPIGSSDDKSLHTQKYVSEPQKIVHVPQKIVQQPQKTVQQPQKIVHVPQKCIHEQPKIEANNSVTKSPIAPPLFYKAPVKNFNSVTNNIRSADSNNEIKRTIRRLKSVELLEQTERSIEEKTELNDIQRRIQNLKTVEINKITSTSNGFIEVHTVEHNQMESVSVRSTTETDCFQSSPILPRRAQLFKQQQNLANSKITSPNVQHINHGNLNYKVKPVTSFSRDLQLTPNRYPEKIPVTKTVDAEPVFFSDIKFAINSNGEVVRS